MTRYTSAFQVCASIVTGVIRFLFQTLGVWVLTVLAQIARVGAAVAAVASIPLVVWCCIVSPTDPGFEWSWIHFLAVFLAIGFPLMFELCMRMLSKLMPEERIVIL